MYKVNYWVLKKICSFNLLLKTIDFCFLLYFFEGAFKELQNNLLHVEIRENNKFFFSKYLFNKYVLKNM